MAVAPTNVNITVYSYDGRLNIGLVDDPVVLPKPCRFLDRLETSCAFSSLLLSCPCRSPAWHEILRHLRREKSWVMKRLSGTDALFRRPRPPCGISNAGGLTILDPSESERFSFEELKKTTLERLPAVPKFTWKLKEVPLHLDRAVWVEDKDFDIDRHLRRIVVPSPGGRREVGELVGMLMSYQLDRRRPLWEMWYVEGRRRRSGGDDHEVPPLPDGRGCPEPAWPSSCSTSSPTLPRGRSWSPREGAGPYEPSDLELVARRSIPTLQTPRKLPQYAVRTAQRG